MIITQPKIQEIQTTNFDLSKFTLSELQNKLPEKIKIGDFAYRLYFTKMPFTGLTIVKYAFSINGAGYLLTRGNTQKKAVENMINELINLALIKI